MAEMPAAEFAAWRVSYDIDPWGEELADVRSAVGHSIADSARQKANPKPFKDYMPFYYEPEDKRPGDPEAGKKIWRALVSAWNKATGKKASSGQGAVGNK